MNENIFVLKDVHFSYPAKQPALCGIDMAVRRGEKIAVIGANGTGKSTLLHLLDGLIFADQGTVTAFGRELNEHSFIDDADARDFRSKVGLVFQNADIQLFCPSVREDIAFGPLQLGAAGDEVKRRLAAAAQTLEVGHLLDRAPHRLSIGEKKKVAIASVFAIDPDVLIFDEPTAGLDPLTVRHIVDLITQASRRGKTIIVATHDLHIVGEIADTVYVLDRNKRIIKHGAPAEILADEALLRDNNLVHLHAHRHDGKVHSHPHLHREHHHEP